jgi:Ser-tRNA(Ala) deacylase AlaX
MNKTIDPRMHSAEHILNRTMDRAFACGRSFNAHVEKKKSKCDYRFDRALSDEEIRSIETKVNEVIRENLPVTEFFLSKQEAMDRYHLGKLPADAGDTIRIVRIGDYDACPCIGPHVGQTGEIGRFVIASTEFKEKFLRVRFKLEQDRSTDRPAKIRPPV